MSHTHKSPDVVAERAATDIHKLSGDERGVALVIMLVILSLTIALGLAMYVSANSDLLINGFYRNFHGSFYAADSGLNVARAQLLNQLVGSVPGTFAVPPIANPATVATNALNSVTTNMRSANARSKHWSSSAPMRLMPWPRRKAATTSKSPRKRVTWCD